MTLTEQSVPNDGRVARRERNIAAVLEVVIEMYGEDLLFPTIEQASKRSGLSLRSLYRYFADPGELHEAAIKHHRVMTSELSHLPSIGQGPLEQRIDDFVAMRVRLFEAAAPVFRASVHTAGTNAGVRQDVTASRRRMSHQFELQFAAELDAAPASTRNAIFQGGDVLTQLDSLDLLRSDRGLSVAETTTTLTVGLRALFGA